MGLFLVHFLGYSLFAVWVMVWVKPVPVDFREALFLK